MRSALSSCLFLSVLAAGTAAGHDMWLRPSSFAPGDEPVAVALWVGHGGESDPVARNPARIERFAVLGPGGRETPVPGVEGSHPAGLLTVAPTGTSVVVYVSDEARSVLGGESFDAYLAEEGLDSILEARRLSGSLGAEGRERYSRSLKTLLATDGGFPRDRETGIPLEIRLLGSSPSDTGNVRTEVLLSFRGKPLVGALVDLESLDDPNADRSEARTDERGRATFTIGPGAWKLATVHMQPIDEPDAEWRSWWATTTFFVPGPAGEGR